MSTHATDLNTLLSERHIRRGDIPATRSEDRRWSFPMLEGRLVELVGTRASSALTAAMGIVYEAQQSGENVAWICQTDSLFFPPDAAARGIDLNALVIVRLSCPADLYLAADYLLRSNGFGLVVIDAGDEAPKNLDARQSRLQGLARKNHAAAMIVRRRHLDAPTSLTAQAARTTLPGPRQDIRFRSTVTPLRDRQSGAKWCHEDVCHGPDGLY